MDAATLNDILTFIEADYRVTDKLPATGQREVFHGSQISSGSKCIIKLCPINPTNLGRIQREIRVLGSLNSEYFPKPFYQTFITDSILLDFYDSFDIRQEEQQQRLDTLKAMKIRPFLLTAEEYIDHILWKDCIEYLKNEFHLIDFLIRLFEALSLLWKAQIAHRDLKPDNILLRPDLRPVIIDLGIAKSFRPGTQDFSIIGTPCTPRYAAPEQLKNTKTDITYKTDQFAVGVIAYYILTGQFPYGDVCEIGPEILNNFTSGNLGNICNYNDSVSKQLVQFIEKLLQVHPHKRFRNVETIIVELNKIKETIE